jgi:hypothetical protein
MADTKRTQTEILALLADNVTGDISPQDLRDAVVSGRANEGGAWAFYTESTAITQGTSIAIAADTRTQLLADGLGSATYEGQIQEMPTPWASNKLALELDNFYNVRLTFKAQIASAAGGHYITTELDIGGAVGVTWSSIDMFAKGAAVEHAFQYSVPIFARSTFVANGGTFYVEADTAMEIWDVRVLVNRVYKPDN